MARRLAALGATALVTWFVVARAGLGVSELRSLDLTAWTPSWSILAVSSGLLLAGYVTSAYQWGWIVEDLGGPRIPPVAGVRLFMVANLGRYVPGKIWPIAGLAILARPLGVPAGTATAAALMGQATALLGAGLLGLGSVPAADAAAGVRWGIPALVLLAIGAALSPPILRRGVRLWFRLARVEGELAPPRTRHVLGWVIVGLFSWVLYGGAFWALVRGLGLESPALFTASAFAAAYLLGYLAVFAPAGLGVREGFLVALLSPNLGPAMAGAVAITARVWTTVLEVGAAAALWTHSLAARPNGQDLP